jgi:hypothetical protein
VADRPRLAGAVMPTPGALRPIQRVPSGLPARADGLGSSRPRPASAGTTRGSPLHDDPE